MVQLGCALDMILLLVPAIISRNRNRNRNRIYLNLGHSEQQTVFMINSNGLITQGPGLVTSGEP